MLSLFNTFKKCNMFFYLMSDALKVRIKDANKVKVFLVNNGYLDFSKKLKKEEEFILFPIVELEDADKKIKKVRVPYEIVNVELEENIKRKNFKELAQEKLTEQEIERLKTSYDIVGDIAILEIDKELRKNEKLIAELLLESNQNVKTIVRKKGSHEGTFRTQKMEHLAGEKKKETIHKENGVALKMDIEKVYYSARQSTERKRVAEQVAKDERVLVLFSGCAPFPCVIAKNSEAKYVCGVELNPDGHEYGLENVEINKLNNVYLSNRNAKKIEDILRDFKDIPDFDPHFDRIVMPLPKTADEFLDQALFLSKRGTIIHFYDFQKEDETQKSVDKIEKGCHKNLMKAKILDVVKCGQQSPHTYRICVDFSVY